MNRITQLLSMIGLLALTYGMDRVGEALRRYRTMTFKMLETFWIDLLLVLVFAGALVLLAWLVLVKSERDMTIGWVYVIVGLLAFFLSTPYSWNLINRIPFPLSISIILTSLGFNLFRVREAAAFIAMLGLADLLRKPRLSASV